MEYHPPTCSRWTSHWSRPLRAAHSTSRRGRRPTVCLKASYVQETQKANEIHAKATLAVLCKYRRSLICSKLSTMWLVSRRLAGAAPIRFLVSTLGFRIIWIGSRALFGRIHNKIKTKFLLSFVFYYRFLPNEFYYRGVSLWTTRIVALWQIHKQLCVWIAYIQADLHRLKLFVYCYTFCTILM